MANGHIAELTLRRRRAGEALGAEAPAIEAHATACADCRARLARARRRAAPLRAGDLVRSFRGRASSARRAARVRRRRAVRGARRGCRRWPAWRRLRAASLIFVTSPKEPERGQPHQGRRGDVIVRVAGSDGQRTRRRRRAPRRWRAASGCASATSSGGHRYLLSLSIDDRGEVTPLYPERGRQPAAARRRGERDALPARQPRS